MKTRNLSDWVVALAVIACSAILFVTLAFALSGRVFGTSGRAVRVNFHDVTGIKASSVVKYAGAAAGTVSEVRMLTPEERAASGDPLNAVQITLALDRRVPELPSDVKVTVAADTLLSDKFVLLSGGSPQSGPLAQDAVLQGISPITFDQLARNTDAAIEGLRNTMGEGEGSADALLAQVRELLTEVRSVVNDTRPLLGDIRAVAGDARELIVENRQPLKSTIQKLDAASGSLDQLAKRGDGLLRANEKNISVMVSDFKVSSENLKVTSTYLKILSRNLTLRPSQLIWGPGKAPPLPSQSEILKARGPMPLN